MKPLQLFAVLIVFIACLSVISWVMSRAPIATKTENVAKTPKTDEAEAEKDPEDAEKKDDDSGARENPFQMATGPNMPKIEVVEKEYEFGRMALGSTGQHDFVIKNVGTGPAKLAKGPVQCKCTVAGLKKDELLPGEEAVIHLSWTPKDEGPFAQSATIWSNDPEYREIKFIVSGEMFPEVGINPTNGWSLGPISNSNDVPLNGFIESAVYKEFKITKVDLSSDRVELEAVAMTPQELEERGMQSGYHLRGRLKGLEKPQKIEEKVTVETDLKNLPRVEFPINGSRTGSITLFGPGWYAGGPLLELGNATSSKGKEIKLTVMVEPAEEEMKLTEVIANPAFLKATLKPEQIGKELPRERYSLFITVPEGSPRGVWTSANPGQLILKTNHPLVQELAIKIHLNLESN